MQHTGYHCRHYVLIHHDDENAHRAWCTLKPSALSGNADSEDERYIDDADRENAPDQQRQDCVHALTDTTERRRADTPREMRDRGPDVLHAHGVRRENTSMKNLTTR